MTRSDICQKPFRVWYASKFVLADHYYSRSSITKNPKWSINTSMSRKWDACLVLSLVGTKMKVYHNKRSKPMQGKLILRLFGILTMWSLQHYSEISMTYLIPTAVCITYLVPIRFSILYWRRAALVYVRHYVQFSENIARYSKCAQKTFWSFCCPKVVRLIDSELSSLRIGSDFWGKNIILVSLFMFIDSYSNAKMFKSIQRSN